MLDYTSTGGEASREQYFEQRFHGFTYKISKFFLDRYLIKQEIKSGSFGSVFEIFDTFEFETHVIKFYVVSYLTKALT